MATVGESDTVTVWKLDRLGRFTSYLVSLIGHLRQREALDPKNVDYREVLMEGIH